MQTQRALLFILPVIMVAVLLVGIFFGYKGYLRQEEQVRELEHASAAEEPTQADPMFLTVVSSAYPLDADYVPELIECRGVSVSPALADSLERMLTDASSAGHEITVTEGYISYEEQKEKYDSSVAEYKKKTKSSIVKAEATVRKTTPREGESEQQTGLVVYLDAAGDESFDKTPAYSWLIKNCASYGFVLRYAEPENAGGLSFSPHLFRYVGADNAYYITAYDMSFDEYAAYVRAQ